MYNVAHSTDTERYARCIQVSKRVRWDIDEDVIRGRSFDFTQKFLPDGLSRVDELDFLTEREAVALSQVQGRTYANMFALVERFINAEILQISSRHWLGDQTALEALVRFCDEELKHQRLFRRLEDMMSGEMPEGYAFLPDPDEVARAVLGKSTWAVIALTCHIELFSQAHYKKSIEPAGNLSELFKDVFLFHWKEESQHAVMDELEWRKEDGQLTAEQRDRAVDDLIELVAAVDDILQVQAPADVRYFCRAFRPDTTQPELERLNEGVLAAYRWQYIVSGVQHPEFVGLLGGMINETQAQRIEGALAARLSS